MLVMGCLRGGKGGGEARIWGLMTVTIVQMSNSNVGVALARARTPSIELNRVTQTHGVVHAEDQTADADGEALVGNSLPLSRTKLFPDCVDRHLKPRLCGPSRSPMLALILLIFYTPIAIFVLRMSVGNFRAKHKRRAWLGLLNPVSLLALAPVLAGLYFLVRGDPPGPPIDIANSTTLSGKVLAGRDAVPREICFLSSAISEAPSECHAAYRPGQKLTIAPGHELNLAVPTSRGTESQVFVACRRGGAVDVLENSVVLNGMDRFDATSYHPPDTRLRLSRGRGRR